MILLRPDCLVFKTANGENIPCSAYAVTVELVSESADWLDQDLVQNAAEAVLHYFKQEKGQHTVSVAEFTEALERVLRGLGLQVKTTEQGSIPSAAAEVTEEWDSTRVFEADLSQLAEASGDGRELSFFPQLRATVRQELTGQPVVLRFRGLKPCVKQLTGARRWTKGCRELSDQIVEFLRQCVSNEKGQQGAPNCALVVW